ncbi:MAG: GAF domain-containing protein [Candidatus Binatia bacterium]
MQASAGIDAPFDSANGRVAVGQSTAGLIAQQRAPILANPVVGDPGVHEQQWAKQEGLVAFAGYPLLVDNRLVGVMAMFARKPLSDAFFQAMASVANDLAVGIQRKLAEARARQHFNRIRALHAKS